MNCKNSLLKTKSESKFVVIFLVILSMLSVSLLFAYGTARAGNNAWSQVGLAGATSEALTIDPNNPNILYAGTSSDLFKSTDSGSTWTLISESITNMDGISGIAVDPNNSNTIYASTHWQPLYKSTNGGTDWIMLDVSSSFTVSVSPADSNIVLSGNGKIWRSSDGGESWEKKSPPGLVNVRTIVFSPSAPNIVYAGTFEGIWRSTDSGSTWTTAHGGFVSPPHIYSVAVDPFDSQIVYIGTGHDGIYKTLNGGQSWTSVSTGLESSTIFTIAVDPNNRNIIYAGGTEPGTPGVYKSTDQGQTWSPMMNGMGTRTVFALAIGGNNPKNIFAAARTGIWRYSDSTSNNFLPVIVHE